MKFYFAIGPSEYTSNPEVVIPGASILCSFANIHKSHGVLSPRLLQVLRRREVLRQEAAGKERRGGDHGNQYTGGKRQSGPKARNGTDRRKRETRERIAVQAGFSGKDEMRQVQQVMELEP